ncbi:hypothetical protein ACQ86N_09105 [Puia sp. P3]|uniref:hypothetical protein n=1 Tax=Puia sp. P3 TaxID=3423952 RepID=UPI003D67D1C9
MHGSKVVNLGEFPEELAEVGGCFEEAASVPAEDLAVDEGDIGRGRQEFFSSSMCFSRKG